MTGYKLIDLVREIVRLLEERCLVKEVKTEIITRPTSMTTSETIGSNTTTKYHITKW